MSTITMIPLACGLTLVAEPIENVASVALNWLLPVGAAGDDESGDGHAAMLSEMVFRGAAGMSSREHSDALDRAGVQRSSSVLTHHMQLSATMLGSRIGEALPLLAKMVREPALPSDAIEPVRSLCLQSLDGLDDDPQHLVMIRLREQHLATPFSRSGYGDRSVLEIATVEQLRASWEKRCVPTAAILAVAGDVDPPTLAKQLDTLLGDWAGQHEEPAESASAPRGYRHVEQQSAQLHIGLAYDAPREADDDSMLERLATAVLSGSTSGRLFTEVRAKRSLCYSVGAAYRAGRDDGLVSLYAGTTPDRAQETLDVSVGEIERLFGDSGNVSHEEFDRAVVGLKSHLIMQGESTPARASAVGREQFALGRARTLDELAASIDAITVDALNEYTASRRLGEYTVVTVGPSSLAPPSARTVGGAAPAC